MIKNFVLQGGDPTGTGMGGVSYFGRSFEDEFNPKLMHKGKGILSMANSGKNSNNSQFFITLAPCGHLDNKHSVFGEVVGNIKLLDDLESIGSNKDDKPLKEIKIINMEIFANPFRDAISEILVKEFSEKFVPDKGEQELEKKIELNLSQRIETGDIGKYLGKKRAATGVGAYKLDPYIYEKPNVDRKGRFDFSNW
jgi:peptidyl-prolyl cis-trans isomerase-like protein 2